MNLTLGNTRLIIDSCLKRGLLRNETAYVLATGFWETGKTMVPVREYGGETYLKSKPYYPYVGMGFCQITWLINYQRATKELGVDFVSDPQKLLIPEYSAEIIVAGMSEGWFTGKKLSDYITLSKSDFVNARRIINGMDKAALIAGFATIYDGLLKEDGYGETAQPVPPPVVPPAVPALVQPSVIAPAVPIPSPTPAQTPTAPAANSIVAALLSLISSFFKRNQS